MNGSLFEVIYGLAHQSAGLDQIIIFFAVWWPWIVGVLAIIIAMALASRDRAPRRLGFIIFVPIIAWLIAHILKVILAWPRPAIILNDDGSPFVTAYTAVKPLFSADGAAFPSGHATFFFALSFALYPFHPRLATFVSLSAIVISLARVAAGVHWPGDILGGFVLAGVVALISWTLAKTRFPAFAGRERV